MKVIRIKLQVPDNSCKGCTFLKHNSKEVGYQQYSEQDVCSLFRCEINNFTKCVACQSCEVDE